MSNKQQGSLLHKVYGKVAALGGQNAVIERDRLRFMYDLHRHNVHVSTNSNTETETLHRRLIDSFVQEGWELDGICVKKGNAAVFIELSQRRNGGQLISVRTSVR